MTLSNRIRPDVEAAPWVIEEIKKLEETATHNAAGIKHLHDEIAFYMDGLDKAKAENAKLRFALDYIRHQTHIGHICDTASAALEKTNAE